MVTLRKNGNGVEVGFEAEVEIRSFICNFILNVQLWGQCVVVLIEIEHNYDDGYISRNVYPSVL